MKGGGAPGGSGFGSMFRNDFISSFEEGPFAGGMRGGGAPGGSGFGSMFRNDFISSFEEGPFAGGMRGGGAPGGSGFGSMFRNDFFSSFGEGSMRENPNKASPIEYKLPCSLEELYKGTTKKMKISREILYASRRTMPIEEILTIDIKPGWKKGTKITFPEKGNEHPNIIPADLVFVIDEKPHSVFTRDGNDLVVTQRISLAEALTGYTVNLKTLDGRTLTIPITNVITPTYEEVVPKEGMPISKDPSKKGNLRIKFNIRFPARLSAEQKAGINKLLAT